MQTIIALIIGMLLSVTAHADTLAKSSCSRDNENRIIEIQRDPKVGGCVLMYTKFDVRKRIAKSRYNVTHCESVKAGIEQNLSSSGYTCSDVDAERSTASE